VKRRRRRRREKIRSEKKDEVRMVVKRGNLSWAVTAVLFY
jgi:hypothetical protein